MPRCVLYILLLCCLTACNRLPEVEGKLHAPYQRHTTQWADSMLLEMTTDEKIGQLLFLQTDLRDTTLEDSLFYWTKNYYLGGVLLKQLPVGQYVDIMDSLQRSAAIPLFNATDQQLALNNQFSDAVQLPLPATTSAIFSDSIQTQLNQLYLRQCQALGINFSFSPTVNFAQLPGGAYDMNTFESDEEYIIHRSSKRLHLLQDQKIIAVASSFRDLEYRQPQDSSTYVDSILHRYYNLVHNGLSGMLVDEKIYAIDTFDQLPPEFVSNYLERELEFEGLLVAQVDSPATVDRLIYAGTDVFVVKNNPRKVAEHLRRYVEEGLISKTQLNTRVRKVLLAKSWMGLDSLRPQVNIAEADHLLLNKGLEELSRQLYQSALTLVQNPDSLLPLRHIHRQHLKVATVGSNAQRSFRRFFDKYASAKYYRYEEDGKGQLKPLSTKRFKRATTIVTLDGIQLDSVRHRDWIASVNDLSQRAPVILVNFGNAFNLQHFDTTLTMVQAFESNTLNESLAVQLLFGAVQAEGRLPLALNEQLPYGQAAPPTPLIRLAYTVPEEVGIASYKLVGIDAVFKNAIQSGATPGGQVLIAKSGKVIYHKAFGHHSNNKKQPVQLTDLYDLASITKVAATTVAAMKLYGDKQFKMSDRFSKHLDVDKKSDIGKVTFKQLFTHQSGLQPNMPIAPFITLKDTVDMDCNPYFCKVQGGDFQVQIADSVYMDTRWVDTIWQNVLDLSTRRRKSFRYSDVNFNLIQYFIERATKQKIDEYVQEQFYEPLNLRYTTYNPLEQFDPEKICPTADDQRWRKQLLDGYVHDESAALFGGVGGNAGLFSNSGDLAVIFQMLLNGGQYGGEELLDPETIQFFTKKGHGNHRGLGFDKPAKRRRAVPSYAAKASPASYGHTGFTGPCVWVDPEHELIYIFIANRVHPDPFNRKLFRKKIRSRIHNIVYEAFDSHQPFVIDRSAPPVAGVEELQAGL
ncbi:MAG: serine hydrolase [Bacteroidota bacterium]